MRRLEDWSAFQRQPHAAIWLQLVRTTGIILKNVWPLLAIAFIRSNKSGFGIVEITLIVVPAVIFIVALLEFLTFRFCVVDNQLKVRRGWLQKQQTDIPLNNIQGINLQENWLHRLVGLVELAIDSPGTEETELKIQLKRTQAQALKSFILDNHTPAEHQIEKPNTLMFGLSASELVKLGLSANHLETLAIIAGVTLSFLTDVRDLLEEQLNALWEASAVNFASGSLNLVLTGILLILVISVTASFVRIGLRYANFRLTKTAQGLLIKTGLVNSAEQVIPFEKIQYASWKANWIRQKISMYMVRFHAIGDSEAKRVKMLIPAPSNRLRADLIAIYANGIDDGIPRYSISTRYVFRKTLFFGIIPGLIGSGALYFLIGWWISFIIFIPVFAAVHFWLAQRKFRFAWNDELLYIRNGAFGEGEILIRWKKIQSVKLSRSLYQQQHGLADIIIYSAGGIIRIPYADIAIAHELLNYAVYQVESGGDWQR